MRLARVAFLAALASACASAPPPPRPPPASAPAPVSTEPAPLASPVVPTPPENADDAAIAEYGKRYVDLVVAISPETGTLLGIHDRDTELDDRSIEGFARDVEKEEKLLGELRERFAQPHASRAAKSDLAILEGTLAADVRFKRAIRPLERSPDVYAAPMNAIFLMTARSYAPAAERAKNVLARLEKIPGVVALGKKNLKSPPKVWTQVGIEMADGAAAFFDEQKAPLEAALPGEKKRIERLLRAAKDAYADYARFLKKEVLPRGGDDFAAGKELFEGLLRETYFIDQSADELAALGKRVFDRTNEQMNELAKKIDPKAKSWPEVTARLKAHHPTAKDLLDAYRREVARSRKFLEEKDAVPFPPGDDCEVIETPPFQRSTITAAYDQPPPFDATTKGFFFVTPVDLSLSRAKQEAMLRENDHGDLVDTAVHEVYPGHHLQLSFARLNPSIVRKATGPSIFAEGWALYAEEVMAELGYYTDEERLMQLEWTLVRAARVLIDVGLHTKGMSFDAAVKMLTDDVHLERPLAESEVKRYTMSPTQPLAYLVGREAIFALREKVRAKEGASFSLKKFHEDVLSRGTVAPGILEKEILGE